MKQQARQLCVQCVQHLLVGRPCSERLRHAQVCTHRGGFLAASAGLVEAAQGTVLVTGKCQAVSWQLYLSCCTCCSSAMQPGLVCIIHCRR